MDLGECQERRARESGGPETDTLRDNQGMLVEAHAEGTENDWQKLVQAGVPMCHANKPAKMKAFSGNFELQNQSEN